MSINGNGDTLTITGARLKVSGGVQVSGSIAYTDDATGFGGVSAQIDADNTTLNITAGKTSGVAKIERGTTTNITGINHANVSNNTTIHIALKNTSSNKGDFVTIGTFADDDTVKVNYTDEYVIGPGETGMLTLRKVAGVLSLFIREMFSSNATNTDNKPFYIKDGTNYKYPLYKTTGGNLVTETIGGIEYYKPSSGLKTKTRPPLGIPELIVSPSGNLAIGNSPDLTTVNYDVWGVPSSFGYGSIYQGGTKKTSFVLENGEASGSFTESGVSSGDAYSLYVNGTDTSSSSTLNIDTAPPGTILAFHYGNFSSSYYSGAHATVGDAANAGYIYYDTPEATYSWGTLSNITNKNYRSVYTWTPPYEMDAYVLLVGSGGSGGRSNNTGGGGGGGGGGVILSYNTLTNSEKIIEVPEGANSQTTYKDQGNAGFNTYFSGIGVAFGGGRGGGYNFLEPKEGGSGGGSAQDNERGGSSDNMIGRGITGQGFDGGDSSTTSTTGSGSGGGGAGGVGGDTVSDTQGGNGGEGRDVSSIFGTTYGVNGIFGGGGGGGVYNSSGTSGSGGSGGGGEGGLGNDSGSNAIVHTGGGGGGSSGSGSSSGSGGSGIVLVKFMGSGKTIPKVTGASFDSTNVTFTVQGSMSDIKYTINGGSEQTTPVGTLAVAHGLSVSASITVVAYAVDANGDQISTKKTVTGTIPQPTLVNSITITGGAWDTSTYDHVNTDVSNTYYEYGLSIAGESVKENYYIAYNWTTRKWFDTQPTNHHNTFGTSSSDLNTTSRETTENPAVVYVFDTSPRFTAQFNNPYYQS
jgi:hypothetical protein